MVRISEDEKKQRGKLRHRHPGGVLRAVHAGQGSGLGEEAEYLAAEINVADVVHPFGAEIDLDERAVLAHADVDVLLGSDARVVDSGLCDIVMNVVFHFKLPPMIEITSSPLEDDVIMEHEVKTRIKRI